MRYSDLKVVFQEIPNEVSMAFFISGCPLNCKGCHSADLRNEKIGTQLNAESIYSLVSKHKNSITCVLFLGGEWESVNLIKYLKVIKTFNLKTALYTGLQLEEVPKKILAELDYIKFGPYVSELGGLKSKNTNQVLLNLQTKEILNHFFTED